MLAAYDITFFIVAVCALLAAVLFSKKRGLWFPANLLVFAVLLRIVGSQVRYQVLGRSGDAMRYYHVGLDLAENIWAGILNPLTLTFWVGADRWWGTPFMDRVSALVLAVIGPSIRAEFLVFALAALAGLFAVGRAYHNLKPSNSEQYLRWLWLWPSLWFWPSSIGKEAVVLLGVGLVTLGYLRREGFSWPLYVAGFGLAFAIRPHVGAVLGLATLTAHWLRTWDRFTPRRFFETILALVISIGGVLGMQAQFGIEDVDLEEYQEFIETTAQRTLRGGSSLGTAPIHSGGIPLAFVNVWMRPFPWEAHNATALFAGAEMIVLWWLVWRRRRHLRQALRGWYRDPALRFAIPFLVIYTLLIGMAFGNMGIIARQRSLLFPFAFMVVLAVPTSRVGPRQRAGAPVRPEAYPRQRLRPKAPSVLRPPAARATDR